MLLTFALVLSTTPAAGQAGSTVKNGTSSGIIAPGFLFEPEVPFTSLKNIPLWFELEQMLDNPYAFAPDPTTPGNDQGFPSYRTTITRRPGYGVTLPQFLVHPLNYNTTTGEEMRLLNPLFPQTNFNVIDEMVETSPGTFTWTRTNVPISAGSGRVEGSAIDYNSPIPADQEVCVVTTELNPPEGTMLCGGDPGEPRYLGFGVLNALGYSTPAVPLRFLPFVNPPISNATVLSPSQRLFDPTRIGSAQESLLGFIPPRSATSGAFGLRKPSLRIPQNGGTPSNPHYTLNTNPNNVTASSENDYIRDRNAAIALGKALFWDMQVGSDGVQACGTCHFNGTGTDTRTKNQLNPNHINNNDTLLQLGDTDSTTAPGSKAANYTLKASDFPLHKLNDPDFAGDPACAGVTADASVIPYAAPTAGVPGGPYLESQRFSNPVANTVLVCDSGNVQSDVNDVVSSMGVVFSPFTDIAPIGQFLPDTDGDGITAVAPDIRTAAALDPLPVFQGLRRVEPRNTPTMQAAGFNFDNFWDGRARHDFNGGSVFGASDPQAHVFVGNTGGALTATRQIIRFTSIASLATGPGLSEFEMSFAGRNWAKIGKKLLQRPTAAYNANTFTSNVTPLANQLVDPNDSVLGIYSNQNGSACAGLPAADHSPGTPGAGKPGLCINYPGLIRRAFYPALWHNSVSHLNGCYTSGVNSAQHPVCSGLPPIPVLAHPAEGVDVYDPTGNTADPFDGYRLTAASGAAGRLATNQFTQMEGNFSLFWGLAVQSWVNILVPDNTPFDQFLDANPGAFEALGEPGESGLVNDQLNCTQTADATWTARDAHFCFTPVGNFKRDPGVKALRNAEIGGGVLVVSGGNRAADAPDPLLGLDLFFASNLSLKNPNFRTGRCGECHAIPTLTDHTMPFTSKINLMDAVNEFATPGIELVVEPLARLRVISGFLLEAEIGENGQDAVERRIVDQSLVPCPIDGLAYPGAMSGVPGGLATLDPATYPGAPCSAADQAFLDNGIYNLGVRPIKEDIGRGGTDAFGWPLSLSVLMLKNLEGPNYNPGGDVEGADHRYAQPSPPGIALSKFDPGAECFGLFEPSAQDPQINPGCEGEPADPQLPPYLGLFANNITVGDFPPEMDEAGGAIGGMVNTLTDVPIIEGFMDTLGPFNPGNIAAEVLNFGGFSDRAGDISHQMGTWPNVNRVGRMGSFKAAQLRNVELTNPYFHNGGQLTLRQVVDFYTRGGDFPVTNAAHRDFNLVNMNVEIQSNLNEQEKVSLVDFLLELTDERNRHDRAPFDHPEVIVPIDGTAPDNTGRTALLSNPLFQSIPAVGAGGGPAEQAFLGVERGDRNSPNCSASGPISHYCRKIN
jgi:cytochrome c peroxidase